LSAAGQPLRLDSDEREGLTLARIADQVCVMETGSWRILEHARLEDDDSNAIVYHRRVEGELGLATAHQFAGALTRAWRETLDWETLAGLLEEIRRGRTPVLSVRALRTVVL